MKSFKKFILENNAKEKNLTRSQIEDLPVGSEFYYNSYSAKKVSDTKVEIKYPMKPASRVPISSLRESIDESLTEAKYEVEVEVRDARAANDLAKDMFRGSYKNDGSNVFIFKNEDDYEEFKDELEAAGLKLMESLNEAVSIDKEFMKISSMVGDVKNSFRDVARQIRKETDMPQRDYERLTDSVEDIIVQLRKELDDAQTKLKKW